MESNLQYAKREYWNERFKTEEDFEWLTGLKEFEHLLLPIIKTSDRIAHLGCGSSKVSMELFKLGYKNLTNIDYSEVLIETNRSKYPEMSWVVDDIRTLANCQSTSFDVVFEKATLEALLVGEKSCWDPSSEALQTLESIFHSICRVLKPGGLFISISFTQPHFRIPALLREKRWSVSYLEFGDSFHYYVYVCKVGETPEESVADRFSRIAPSWLREL